MTNPPTSFEKILEGLSIAQTNSQYGKLQASRNPRKFTKGATVMRLQPLTLAHEELIAGGLAACDTFCLVIGSSYESPSIKNPFSFEMRRGMVEARFPDEVKSGRLLIVGLQDYVYRPKKWYSEFNDLVHKTLGCPAFGFVLYTFGKDEETTAYINDFDKRIRREFHTSSNATINATDARLALFRGVEPVSIPHLSNDVVARLYSYKLTEDYQRFATELKAIDEYREQWSELKDKNGKTIRCPFPVQFMAVDALVTWKDRWGKPYFLVIKRKSEFGNGKLAIPGGFLDHNESALTGAIRELKEETGLAVDDSFILHQTRVFDDPARSMRGRMVTFCHVWEVCSDTKPVVVGADDAEEAFWIPFDEVYSRKRDFFSDHYYILSFFNPKVEDTF